MAKKVSLNIDVGVDGKIRVEAVGTHGTECLDLMSFLDKIPGMVVDDMQRKIEFKEKKVQVAGTQQVQN